MSDNLLLVLGVGVAAAWWLTKKPAAPASVPMIPPYAQPPPLIPAPTASENPAVLNNYFPERAADEAAMPGYYDAYGGFVYTGVDSGDMGSKMNS